MTRSGPPPLPQTPGDVSPAWLTDALGFEVKTVRAEGIGPLEGVNSATTRLHLQIPAGDSTIERNVVLKVPAASVGARGVAAYQRWYEREVGFYEVFAPDAPIRTPGVLFSRFERDGRYALVLEDVGAIPQGDQIAGCNAVAAEVAVRAAARLHARFWDGPALSGHDWLPATTIGVERAPRVQSAFAHGWSLQRDGASPALRSIVDAAVEAYADLVAAAAAPPVALCHGDYRLDNMFLDADGSRLTVIDWQFVCRCRAAYDVAYFLGLDLDADERRRHEPRLLEAYRAELAEHGVAYPLDTFERDYRVGLLLSYAVFCIGAAGQPPKTRAARMHEVGLERLGAAIVDHGAGAVI